MSTDAQVDARLRADDAEEDRDALRARAAELERVVGAFLRWSEDLGASWSDLGPWTDRARDLLSGGSQEPRPDPDGIKAALAAQNALRDRRVVEEAKREERERIAREIDAHASAFGDTLDAARVTEPYEWGSGVMVSDEAVEKAARAMCEADYQTWGDPWGDLPERIRGIWRDEARAALMAALPVIERDLRADERERCAKEIDADAEEAGDALDAPEGRMSGGNAYEWGEVNGMLNAAARVREGGRA